MKKVYLFLAVVVLLFSSNVYAAEECVAGWTASVSDNVVKYEVLLNDEVVVETDKLSVVVSEAPCAIGTYTVVAINSHGIKSDPSESYVIGKPEAPSGFSLFLRAIVDFISRLF